MLPALIASGLLFGVLEWLAVHPSVIAWGFIASLLIFEIATINFFMSRSEKRAAPGVAVVAIETVRSAGRPIPKL
ncbi:MAG: hypothetical protein M3Y75_00690 [Actinomycetota bacterium]|nr:hypothetical protein [Actinomycetota bacterium]